MRRLRRWLTVLALSLAAPAATAQTVSGGMVQSPILVIEFERVFEQSAFGRRVAAALESEGAEIAAENRRIEAELTEEERRLTEERASLSSEAFRALADAFDEKVQRLRREQDSKARALGARSEEEQRRFLAAAQPVLQQLMREAGAAVLVERRSVLLAADDVDITDIAISRVDAAIGDGSGLSPDDSR
ncbi:OmpH family outer membrane protein [Thalassococcus sp. CAU 1522]|uniref:OmpH family outer membrane protein n=1 Tax=Thalassococcus arenae TaxID=2851652 RepID=A0ABS6NA01_9RHOB|nr:OmpH family outer membrane protein [Thalassococcus arenae]MBV2360850.1 OmpH family outer membrane protein [Thalassococcus arenae]